MQKFLARLFAEEEGATMVEYALMVALIAAALVTVVATLGTAIGSSFTSTAGSINSAAS